MPSRAERLRILLTGSSPWLTKLSFVGGFARRYLRGRTRRAAFAIIVRPCFLLSQLLVRAMLGAFDLLFARRAHTGAPLPRGKRGNGKVAVVIPNYQGEPFLPGLLDSLRGQSWPDVEVLVVDNASADASEEVVRGFPGMRWVPMGGNRGFAAAVNRGAAEAGDAEFIALLNNDTEVHPDWARRQVEALRADPRLGMVGARIYQKGFERRINIHAHVLGADLRSYNSGSGETDTGQYDDGEPVLGVSGCSMMIRRQAFEEAGGFDERFFLCYEDVDFSLRLFWLGWDCRVVPDAICHHVSNAHMETGSPLHIRNILHHDLLWVVKDIPAETLRDRRVSFLTAVLRSDEVRLFFRWQGWRVLRWRLEGLAKLPGALRDRRRLYRTRRRPPEELWRFMRPLEELNVAGMYDVEGAERYLVPHTGAPPGETRELFPTELRGTVNFEPPADLSIGARTTTGDPQVHFRLPDDARGFRWLDVEMTCDQPSWAQFIMVCHHEDVGAYVLIGNHFRVRPGRQRYALPLGNGFFAEHQPAAPDLLGRWRRQVQTLRFDPCEAPGARVLLHSCKILL